VVGAALGPGSVPWQAIYRAREQDIIAMSDPVAAEIRDVLARPKFSRVLSPVRQNEIAALVFAKAHWFVPATRVTDCRDAGDDIYLELVLASDASVLVSSDKDLLVLDPWRGARIFRPVEFLRLPHE
jgi:putative PIN family toxin of toxin-antitoxin system